MSLQEGDEGLPLGAKLQLLGMGGEPPQPVTGGRGTMTARIERLGWKILPIPFGNNGVIHFRNPHEWLILPPEDSPIRARKVEGRIVAIREAYRLAMRGEPDAASEAVA